MKKILGLDLGTNSIGWSVIEQDFENKTGKILGLGSRIIPMSQDILGKFDSGQSHSQTAERTAYRGTRRLYQRDNLRRERLHRVLNLLNFLPEHYADAIDFEKHYGQFKEPKKGDSETKLNYKPNWVESKGKYEYEFIFKESFNEMLTEFVEAGHEKIPYDWTIYYLRKKALSQKITKEELAWLILNFNQKRGYYQLRGEETENDGDKRKVFETLLVSEVKATEDTIKKTGEILYDIYFSNGWKYDKQTTKPADWLNRIKEFIVTTSTTKNGDTKRSYKIVDSEKDWIAIKAKTEQNIDNSDKTVGAYIYDTLLQNPSQKIRGTLVRTIERKFYKSELEQILATQSNFHPEFKNRDLYQNCLDELYPRNEAHQNNIKDKDLSYLLLQDIIFYQRPLKSKKSTIANCSYESRTFKKSVTEKSNTGEDVIKQVSVTEGIKAIPKSHPLFQEFRLWQFISNLRIYKKGGKDDVDLTSCFLPTEETWVDLFAYLNNRKEVEQKNIIDYFEKKGSIEKQNRDEYRWNYVEDKKYPCNEIRSQFTSRLSKVEGLKKGQYFDSKTELNLWHIVYSVNDKQEFERALNSFASKRGFPIDSFVENFRKFPPFKSDYASYSEKAIKKLLPLMRMGRYWNETDFHPSTIERIEKIVTGEYDENIKTRVREKSIGLEKLSDFRGLPVWLACYVVYDRHSESSDSSKWNSPQDINKYLHEFKQHSLRNPIVEQVVTETLRTVTDIWDYYGHGAKDYFDEIHVELGREMKNPADKRKQIASRNTENENTNVRIRELLKELMNDSSVTEDIRPYSPSHQEILKIYEDGLLSNPNSNFSSLSEDDIAKIRKNSSPSIKEIKRYRLWLEQGYISPYTGSIIRLSELFSTKYQIEHIIPQARYFDDSMSNKIICESEVNQLKGSLTAFEFLKKERGRKVELSGGKTVNLFSIEAYEEHCNRYFKKNRAKLKKLMSEEIPEGFIERQMNDSRYISKLVKSLLNNIVKDENEKDSISYKVVPVTGSITSKLKHDWGLNDKWNEIVAPRFKRLNAMRNSNEFGYFDKTINAFRCEVPDELKRGFNKKRIDHRHHALDALVIACTTREHINYLNSINAEKDNYSLRNRLLVKNRHNDFTKAMQLPWASFPENALTALNNTVVTFKQNTRVINKTNNKTWQWVDEKGVPKKKLVKQTKGDNWAIRKPLHEETVSGLVDLPWVEVKKGNYITATRKTLDKTFNLAKIQKITDTGAQKILMNYLKQEKFKVIDKKGKTIYNSELAFSQENIDELNKNIKKFNDGKEHKPIYKIRLFEEGSGRFILGNKANRKEKLVQGSPNLFFAIYKNTNTGERLFETVPLNEVIEHQKQVANLKQVERTSVSIKKIIEQNNQTIEVTFLFTLSPYDLIYIPTDNERESSHLVDFKNLTDEQIKRIYYVNDFSGRTCYFTPNRISKSICPKEIDMKYNEKKKTVVGSFDTKTASFNGNSIKERCWKLQIDRLGNILKVIQ